MTPMHIIMSKTKLDKLFTNLDELHAEYILPFKQLEPEEILKAPLKSQMDGAIIDAQELWAFPLSDEVLARLNTYLAIILIVPHPIEKQGQAWLEKLMSHCDRIIAIHHLPLSGLDQNLIINQMRFFNRYREEKNELKKNMIQFSQEIDELVKSTHQEMLKAKKIHEEVVPKRIEDIKGLNVFTKYAVGDGGGTEYIDIIKTPQALFLIGLHTDSYLTSSCLMNLVNKQRQLSHADAFNFKLFFQQAWMEIESINANKKKPVKTKMVLLKIDHASLNVQGFQFGDFEFLSSFKGHLSIKGNHSFDATWEKLEPFSFKLERGEKLIVFSPGFSFNWNETIKNVKKSSFVQEHQSLSANDLVIELFIKIKSDQAKDFLSQDASIVLIEVSKNAIVQL